jgi:hypothetical protein
MEEYKNSSGKNLQVTDVREMSCPGFWKVYFEFDSDLGKQQVNITINRWNVVNAVCHLENDSEYQHYNYNLDYLDVFGLFSYIARL